MNPDELKTSFVDTKKWGNQKAAPLYFKEFWNRNKRSLWASKRMLHYLFSISSPNYERWIRKI